jgi:hypothetical protein
MLPTLIIALGILAVFAFAAFVTHIATLAPAMPADQRLAFATRITHCEHCGSGELRDTETGVLLARFGYPCDLCEHEPRKRDLTMRDLVAIGRATTPVQCSRCGDDYSPQSINGRAVTASGCCYTCNTELSAGY